MTKGPTRPPPSPSSLPFTARGSMTKGSARSLECDQRIDPFTGVWPKDLPYHRTVTKRSTVYLECDQRINSFTGVWSKDTPFFLECDQRIDPFTEVWPKIDPFTGVWPKVRPVIWSVTKGFTFTARESVTKRLIPLQDERSVLKGQTLSLHQGVLPKDQHLHRTRGVWSKDWRLHWHEGEWLEHCTRKCD